MDNSIEKRFPSTVKEKGQYFLAFGVIASMLLVTNFPPLVIFFFAIFAYLIVKMFSAAGRSETRDIFEFYLTSNEILRDDDRRWFGFEIHEAIMRGESISQRMNAAPPLVGFTLGALYNKIGDHKMAVGHLSRVIEADKADEISYIHPSPELRSYVRVLRKIEREPGDAPLTSSAVRSLERARKLRGKTLLNESRSQLADVQSAEIQSASQPARTQLRGMESVTDEKFERTAAEKSVERPAHPDGRLENKRKPARTKEELYSNRKPISELLHDIYDGTGR